MLKKTMANRMVEKDWQEENMYTMNYAEVGENIQKELDLRGMQQRELADELSISKQVMNKIIKGAKAINVKELAKIADVFGVTVDELLRSPGEKGAASSISFMGRAKGKTYTEKIEKLRTAIDEIYLLEEIVDE